jgi:hypothetical protein
MQDSGHTSQIPNSLAGIRSVGIPVTVAGCHRILIEISRRLDFGECCWKLALYVGFRQSDTKIRKPSVVDSGYQQIPMSDGSGFSQTCM